MHTHCFHSLLLTNCCSALGKQKAMVKNVINLDTEDRAAAVEDLSEKLMYLGQDSLVRLDEFIC